jgi:hypothetical protein
MISESWRHSEALMNTYRVMFNITAHDPLSRVDPLLEVLRGYDKIPAATKDVFIFIDHEHANDKQILLDLLRPNLKTLYLQVIVAGPEYQGFALCWSHKQILKLAIETKAYDIYMYSENDMVFTKEHYTYWLTYRQFLKPLNLEPGFCRYEKYDEKCVPFDNYRKWSLSGATKDVWGDRPYRVKTFLTPTIDFVGFVSLGNPYMGLMVLDQEMAEIYVKSQSFDPVASFELTRHRCWPIADRSSMGLAFEGLKADQEHRRVVPIIREGEKLLVAPCGLVKHLDKKYSTRLADEDGTLMDISEMLVV